MLSFALQVIATFVVSLIAFSALLLLAKHRGYISFVASKNSQPILTASIQSPAIHPSQVITSATEQSEDFFDFKPIDYSPADLCCELSIQSPAIHPSLVITSATEKSENFVIFEPHGFHSAAEIYSNSNNALLGSFESEADKCDYIVLDAKPHHATRLLHKLAPTLLPDSNERGRAHSPNTLFALA
jgi:hypothetical protein